MSYNITTYSLSSYLQLVIVISPKVENFENSLREKTTTTTTKMNIYLFLSTKVYARTEPPHLPIIKKGF